MKDMLESLYKESMENSISSFFKGMVFKFTKPPLPQTSLSDYIKELPSDWKGLLDLDKDVAAKYNVYNPFDMIRDIKNTEASLKSSVNKSKSIIDKFDKYNIHVSEELIKLIDGDKWEKDILQGDDKYFYGLMSKIKQLHKSSPPTLMDVVKRDANLFHFKTKYRNCKIESSDNVKIGYNLDSPPLKIEVSKRDLENLRDSFGSLSMYIKSLVEDEELGGRVSGMSGMSDYPFRLLYSSGILDFYAEDHLEELTSEHSEEFNTIKTKVFDDLLDMVNPSRIIDLIKK